VLIAVAKSQSSSWEIGSEHRLSGVVYQSRLRDSYMWAKSAKARRERPSKRHL